MNLNDFLLKLGFDAAVGGHRPQDGSSPERIPLRRFQNLLLPFLIVRKFEAVSGKNEALDGKGESLSGKNVAQNTGKLKRPYSFRSDIFV